jgi:hypothetical protein
MHTRAQITEVSVSGPNFSGTRVVTGMKYKSAAVGRIRVFMSPSDFASDEAGVCRIATSVVITGSASAGRLPRAVWRRRGARVALLRSPIPRDGTAIISKSAGGLKAVNSRLGGFCARSHRSHDRNGPRQNVWSDSWYVSTRAKPALGVALPAQTPIIAGGFGIGGNTVRANESREKHHKYTTSSTPELN